MFVVRRAARHFERAVTFSTGPRPFIKTLNVSDHPWAVPLAPNIGSIGMVLPFPEACALASKHGFDAVNLDMPFLAQHGPAAVREELEKHGLQPGAFRFCVTLTDEASESQFNTALKQFEAEAPQAVEAGFTRSAFHLLPWSCTDISYGEHFRMASWRLEQVAPVLRETGVQVGLEFIGSYGLRRTRKFDFIHTIEGVRSLVASAGIDSHVGLKLDSYHWWATGGLLEEILKLEAHEVVYVELNDAWSGFSKAATPELSRDLPGRQNVIDASGLLAALMHIGYTGPIVAEPFNRPLQSLSPDAAVSAVGNSLDACTYAAMQRMLPDELVGTQPYHPEVLMPLTSPPKGAVTAGSGLGMLDSDCGGDRAMEGGVNGTVVSDLDSSRVDAAFNREVHAEWHRLNSSVPSSLYARER